MNSTVTIIGADSQVAISVAEASAASAHIASLLPADNIDAAYMSAEALNIFTKFARDNLREPLSSDSLELPSSWSSQYDELKNIEVCKTPDLILLQLWSNANAYLSRRFLRKCILFPVDFNQKAWSRFSIYFALDFIMAVVLLMNEQVLHFHQKTTILALLMAQ